MRRPLIRMLKFCILCDKVRVWCLSILVVAGEGVQGENKWKSNLASEWRVRGRIRHGRVGDTRKRHFIIPTFKPRIIWIKNYLQNKDLIILPIRALQTHPTSETRLLFSFSRNTRAQIDTSMLFSKNSKGFFFGKISRFPEIPIPGSKSPSLGLKYLTFEIFGKPESLQWGPLFCTIFRLWNYKIRGPSL